MEARPYHLFNAWCLFVYINRLITQTQKINFIISLFKRYGYQTFYILKDQFANKFNKHNQQLPIDFPNNTPSLNLCLCLSPSYIVVSDLLN